jgi:hypothetical protein
LVDSGGLIKAFTMLDQCAFAIESNALPYMSNHVRTTVDASDANAAAPALTDAWIAVECIRLLATIAKCILAVHLKKSVPD